MAYPSEHYGLCSNGGLRVVSVLVVMFLVCYIVGPQFSSRSTSTAQKAASCTCDCDCSEEFTFTLPLEFFNHSYADCGKNDPEMHQELEKDVVDMLSDEISLQKAVANETLKHTMAATMEAQILFSRYEKEAEKCIAQTEICEEGREGAQTELVKEIVLTKLWEARAREVGWEENEIYNKG